MINKIHQTPEERLTSSIDKNSEMVKNLLEHASIVSVQGKQGPAGKDGRDGETPNIDKVANLVQSRINLEKIATQASKLIPAPKDGEKGKDGSPDTPDEVVDKINSAKKKIDWKRIKNVPDFATPDTMNQIGMVSGGMGDASLKFFVLDLSASLDGVTKTFTITQNRVILDIASSSAPWTFRPTVDYAISGGSRETLTFTSQIDETQTLATGQTLIVTGIRP